MPRAAVQHRNIGERKKKKIFVSVVFLFATLIGVGCTGEVAYEPGERPEKQAEVTFSTPNALTELTLGDQIQIKGTIKTFIDVEKVEAYFSRNGEKEKLGVLLTNVPEDVIRTFDLTFSMPNISFDGDQAEATIIVQWGNGFSQSKFMINK